MTTSSNGILQSFVKNLVSGTEDKTKLSKAVQAFESDANSLVSMEASDSSDAYYQQLMKVLNDWTNLSCTDLQGAGSLFLGDSKNAPKITSMVNFINNDSKAGASFAKLMTKSPAQLNCLIEQFNKEKETSIPSINTEMLNDSMFSFLSTNQRVAESSLGKGLIIALVVVGVLCVIILGMYLTCSGKSRNGRNRGSYNPPRRNSDYDEY